MNHSTVETFTAHAHSSVPSYIMKGEVGREIGGGNSFHYDIY